MEPIPKNAFHLFKEMARPYKGRLAFFFTLTLLGITAWVGAPFAIRSLINELSNDGVVTDKAWYIAGIFVLLRFADEWFWRFGENHMRKTKPPMIERVRSLLFAYTLRKPHGFFVNTSSGKLGHYINQTTATVNETVDATIWGVWPRLMTLVLSSFFLLLSHWTLALLFVVWIGSLLLLNIKRGKKFSEFVESESEARSQAAGQVVDALANNLSVRVFNAQEREVETLHKQQKVVLERWNKSWRHHIVTNAVQGHSVAIAGGFALGIILWLYGRGQISIGDVVLFVAYFGDASSSIWELAWQMNMYFRSFGTIDNALDSLKNGEPERTVAETVPTPTKGIISLKNVTFNYPDQPNQKVLHTINLTIKEGERVGLVGHSGAGKTTLVSLLLNFYDITSGEFSIGGVPSHDLTPSQMRELISFVPQDTSLFNRTISENIAYAKSGASNAAIKKAAADAQALEFINKLPHGFDTMIGERGVKLSGGQRQRIAIARALLKDSPILILDEATSALDSVSEQLIQKAFVSAMKNRTALVVAHRLSTLRHLDKIVVFDGGTIVEQGTHDELVAKEGLYADLWRRQKDGFIGE